jgi:TadE-like protein
MRIAPRQRRSSNARRGTVLVEVLLVAPIFVVLLTAMIEFSMILTARQHLLAASREGCRVAAHGAPHEEIHAAVKLALGECRLSEAEVKIKHFEEDHVLPHAPRDRVQVVVHIPTTRVVPDFLGLIGISFADDELACGTVMSMETLVPHRRGQEREDQ